MASWNDLLELLTRKLQTEGPIAAGSWLQLEQNNALARISAVRTREGKPTNVIFYASAWLQKAAPVPYLSVMPEDINGFMAAMHGMDWTRGLTLVLHTPGGSGSAAQTIMSYLHTKFEYIEVIIPTYAMSAGTMMALGADHLVMGRQSQLGPIDAQLTPPGGMAVSAASIVGQFQRAKDEILGTNGNPGNPLAAHVWAPILQSLGPALLQEAQRSLDYGESMVASWLEKRMCKKEASPADVAKAIASHFNAAELHKSHGRRIDREEIRSKGLIVEDLEGSNELQDAVLTAYHLCTIGFETSPASKMISSTSKNAWVKNYAVQSITSLPGVPTPIRIA